MLASRSLRLRARALVAVSKDVERDRERGHDRHEQEVEEARCHHRRASQMAARTRLARLTMRTRRASVSRSTIGCVGGQLRDDLEGSSRAASGPRERTCRPACEVAWSTDTVTCEDGARGPRTRRGSSVSRGRAPDRTSRPPSGGWRTGWGRMQAGAVRPRCPAPGPSCSSAGRRSSSRMPKSCAAASAVFGHVRVDEVRTPWSSVPRSARPAPRGSTAV